MTWENQSCPCGGKKEPETMLCPECETAFAERRELATFRDESNPVQLRRHAALILVALARGRKRRRMTGN